MVSIPFPLVRPLKPVGVWGWLTTIDHKKIGVLYGTTAFILFLTGGVEALLIRLQLAIPNNTLIAPEVYNQLFTMHGTTMIFLAIMPLGAAFFIGSRYLLTTGDRLIWSATVIHFPPVSIRLNPSKRAGPFNISPTGVSSNIFFGFPANGFATSTILPFLSNRKVLGRLKSSGG